MIEVRDCCAEVTLVCRALTKNFASFMPAFYIVLGAMPWEQVNLVRQPRGTSLLVYGVFASFAALGMC
jgi:hypothetical protein